MKKEPKSKMFKYSRFNGSLEISDPDTISNVKIEQEREIIENQRLGSYDINGKYSISKDIVSDLLKLPKNISSVKAQDPLRGKKDVYRLTAKLPGFDRLEYLLEIDGQFADVYLLEKAYKEGGNYFDTHEVHLKSILVSQENDLTKIMKSLKINTDTDDGGREIEETEIIDLLLRKIYLQSIAQKLKEQSIGAEREVFEDIMTTLKNSGAYGEKILATFVARLDTRKSILAAKGTPEYNKALNDVMMSSIYLQTTDEDLKNSKTKQIYDNITSLRQQTIEPIMQEAKDSITATAVKGKFVERYKQDISKEEMQTRFERLSSTRMVDNEANQTEPTRTPVIDVQTKPNRESRADRIRDYLDKKERLQSQEESLSAINETNQNDRNATTTNRVEGPAPEIVDKRKGRVLEEAGFVGATSKLKGKGLDAPTVEAPTLKAGRSPSRSGTLEQKPTNRVDQNTVANPEHNGAYPNETPTILRDSTQPYVEPRIVETQGRVLTGRSGINQEMPGQDREDATASDKELAVARIVERARDLAQARAEGQSQVGTDPEIQKPQPVIEIQPIIEKKPEEMQEAVCTQGLNNSLVDEFGGIVDGLNVGGVEIDKKLSAERSTERSAEIVAENAQSL